MADGKHVKVGQRVGYVEVISTEIRKRHLYADGLRRDAVKVFCHLCQRKKWINLHHLKNGTRVSCGCRHRAELKNRVFGKLKVLRKLPKKDRRGQFWKCQCACRRLVEVRTVSLLSREVTHCGSASCRPPRLHQIEPNKKRSKIVRGFVSGRLTVLGPTKPPSKKVVCECSCTPGRRLLVRIDALAGMENKKPTRSCGCLKAESARLRRGVYSKKYLIFGVEMDYADVERVFGVKSGTFTARIRRYGFTPEQAVLAERMKPTIRARLA